MTQRRQTRRTVNGVLLLDKSSGVSSNTALQSARRLFNAAKAGHTGTLDPMATGLLPLTFGEATKFSQMLLDADKTYEATIQLGVVTDSGDADGVELVRRPVSVSEAGLLDVLEAFKGEIEQIPPMFSALKRDGRPLYEYARAGIELERAPRKVIIHDLSLLDGLDDANRFRIRVRCSKGTYVRTLATDIGERLGCGAYLSALRRSEIGDLTLAASMTLESLASLLEEERDARLLPADTLVSQFPALRLQPHEAHALLHGQTARPAPQGTTGMFRLYDEARFIGLGELGPEGVLSSKRLISTAESV